MACVNKVLLIGNLTREPEVRNTTGGNIAVHFGMAMTRRFSGQQRSPDQQPSEETCFVDVTAFNRTAEIIRDYCHKGDPLFIEGRLRLDQWDDKATGVKRNKLVVIAENTQLLTRKGDSAAPQGGYAQPPANGGYPQPQPQYAQAPAYQQSYAQPAPAPMAQPPQYAQPQPVPPPPAYRPAAASAPAPASMPVFQPAPAPAPATPPATGGAADAPQDDVPF